MYNAMYIIICKNTKSQLIFAASVNFNISNATNDIANIRMVPL